MDSPRKIRVYIYSSPEQKKHLIGIPHTAIAEPLGHALHMNYQDFPDPHIEQELAYVLTGNWHRSFKLIIKSGLHEGIVVASGLGWRQIDGAPIE